MLEIKLGLCFSGALFCVIMLVKNQLTFKHRMYFLDQSIFLYNCLPSYHAMILDLRRWTKKQWIKYLQEKNKELYK